MPPTKKSRKGKPLGLPYLRTREHRKAYARAYRAANPDKVRAYNRDYYAVNGEVLRRENRSRLRKNRYGITQEEFDERLAMQRNRCAFCHKPFTDTRPPCVDHCHTSGKIRGLLHRGCNTLIGQIENKQKLIATYLRKPRPDISSSRHKPSASLFGSD